MYKIHYRILLVDFDRGVQVECQYSKIAMLVAENSALHEEKSKLSSEIEEKQRKNNDLSQKIEVYTKDSDRNVANISTLLEEKEVLVCF